MSRKKFLMGNWKMNHTIEEANQFCKDVKEASLVKLARKKGVMIGVAPTFLSLAAVKKHAHGLIVAAQDCHYQDHGAYTSNVSASMLKEIDVNWAIIGHSERRDYFKECDCLLNKKVKKAFEAGLTPILCCGETLEQREMGVTMDWIRLQIKSDLAGITADQVKSMVIAYEPIWAIGTGKTATTEQAEEVCKGIRECVKEMYDAATAEAVRIQYGGSVNAGNAAELFAQPDIDGGLVGGASLKADFGKIVNYK